MKREGRVRETDRERQTERERQGEFACVKAIRMEVVSV